MRKDNLIEREGFISILEQEPTETGMYVLKSVVMEGEPEIPAILSTNMKGELVWIRQFDYKFVATHWRKI
jgi:hypothetical protein